MSIVVRSAGRPDISILCFYLFFASFKNFLLSFSLFEVLQVYIYAPLLLSFEFVSYRLCKYESYSALLYAVL